MKYLVLLTLLAGSALSAPTADSYAGNYGYAYNPLAHANAPLAVNPSSQFFAKDELGQYNYGYSGPLSSKQEVKSADGVTRGSYSYVDANGILQTVNYVSDVLGFRVAATNLPKHVIGEEAQAAVVAETAPVAAAAAPVAYTQATVKAVPAQTVVAAQPVAAPAVAATPVVATKPAVLAPTVAYTYLPYAYNYGYYNSYPALSTYTNVATPVAQPVQTVAAAPIPVDSDVVEVGVQTAPAVAAAAPAPAAVVQPAAPVVPIQTQYHAQDELGQYNFGYSSQNSARQEVKSADGVVRGSYNYVDDTGHIQTVEYIADAAGFRAAGTNLPIHEIPALQPTPEDPDVIAARAEHAKLYAEIAARNEELAEIALQNQAEIAAQQAAAAVVPAVKAAPAIQAPVAAAHPAPVAVNPNPIVPAAPVAPTASQYHAQDELGQYNYGYSTAESAKVETRTSDGIVRGSYKYVDGDGKLQTVEYISDALGFRVAATNLPKHVIGEEAVVAAPAPVPVAPAAAPVAAPVVAAEPAPAVVAYNAAPAVASNPAPVVTYNTATVHAAPATPVITPKVANYVHLPYAVGYRYLLQPGQFVSAPAAAAVTAEVKAVETAPVAAVQTPVATAVPAAAPVAHVSAGPSSQYQAQDEAKQYNYGYSSALSAKQETKSADGVVRGSYSYVDANGLVQTVNYISDALGYRATGTNFPGAPMLAPKVNNYAYLPYAVGHPYYGYLQKS